MDPEEKAFDAPFYSVVESMEALDSHYVKGYEHLHGYKIRFETTWLEK